MKEGGAEMKYGSFKIDITLKLKPILLLDIQKIVMET
jgi:hypothetical protein